MYIYFQGYGYGNRIDFHKETKPAATFVRQVYDRLKASNDANIASFDFSMLPDSEGDDAASPPTVYASVDAFIARISSSLFSPDASVKP